MMDRVCVFGDLADESALIAPRDLLGLTYNYSGGTYH